MIKKKTQAWSLLAQTVPHAPARQDKHFEVAMCRKTAEFLRRLSPLGFHSFISALLTVACTVWKCRELCAGQSEHHAGLRCADPVRHQRYMFTVCVEPGLQRLVRLGRFTLKKKKKKYQLKFVSLHMISNSWSDFQNWQQRRSLST